EATCRSRLAEGGVSGGEVEIVREADCSLVGQSSELTVPLVGAASDASVRALGPAFHGAYRQRYGHAAPDESVQAVTWRLTARQKRATAAKATGGAAPVAGTAAPRTERDAHFPEGRVRTKVYRRDALPAGIRIDGPAIVE